MIQQQQQQQRSRYEFEQRRVQHDESMGQAISRVAEAGQHLVLDRLDLLKVEAKAAVDEKITAATEAGKSLGLVAVGAMFLRAGWVTLMVSLGFFLSQRIGVAGALAIIGGVHVVVAAIVLGIAWNKRKVAAAAVKGELRQGAAAVREPAGARS